MLTEFVIDRKRWTRGMEGGQSGLLLENGKMCCLGFAGRACGIAPEALLHNPTPETSPDVIAWPDWTLNAYRERDSHDTDELVRINDAIGTSDAEKEAKIIAIFAKHGVTVRFVDEAPSC